MNRWLPLVVAVLVAWAAFVVLQRWFAQVHREQNARDAALDRREASLEVWSAELEAVDFAGTIRSREIAASALLDRALGSDKPVQQDVAL